MQRSFVVAQGKGGRETRPEAKARKHLRCQSGSQAGGGAGHTGRVKQKTLFEPDQHAFSQHPGSGAKSVLRHESLQVGPGDRDHAQPHTSQR